MKHFKYLLLLLPLFFIISCNDDEGEEDPTPVVNTAPSSIRVNSLIVTDFTDNGDLWDNSSYADLYLVFRNDSEVLYQSGYYENANPSDNFTFTPTNLNMNNPTSTYTIELWDYDSIGLDDLMSAVSFKGYESTRGRPFPLNVGTPKMQVTLNVTYLD